MVLELYEVKHTKKPKAIIKALEEKLGINKAPHKDKVINFLTGHRRRKFGGGMDLGQLSQWCLDHYAIPEGDVEFFVVEKQIFYEEDAADNDDSEDFLPGDIFRFYISTKRLIRLSRFIFFSS